MDKDCGDLGILFQETIYNIKTSFSLWEEFTNKAVKLNSAIKTVIAACSSFQEVFIKLAEMAYGTRGASSDIGITLAKLCARRQAMEIKLKAYTMSLMDLLVAPIQKSVEDWQKSVVQLDKDQNREYKKAHGDLKKAMGEAARLQKKVNKGKTELQPQLAEANRDTSVKVAVLEDVAKRSVTHALVEERSHLCLFASCLKPLLDHEIALLCDVQHLQQIADTLAETSGTSSCLPPSAEKVILDAVQGKPVSYSTETKKRNSKDEPNIAVVTGSLRSNSDAVMQLRELPTSGYMEPESAIPEVYHVKRSMSIQSPGHANSMMMRQRQDSAVADLGHQMPYESCQSLQCSSGYGTMTNISMSSEESGGGYCAINDGPLPCDLSRISKYSTLPNKRLFSGHPQQKMYKPSCPAIQDVFSTGMHIEESPVNSGERYNPYPYPDHSANHPPTRQGPEFLAYGELPPMPVQRQSAYVDYDDDLPPPPEDILPSHNQGYGVQSYQENPYAGRKSSQTLPMNSSLMHNLRNSPRSESISSQTSGASDSSWSACRSASAEADEEGDHSLARQLKGVKLKRTVSYDRSAPKVAK